MLKYPTTKAVIKYSDFCLNTSELFYYLDTQLHNQINLLSYETQESVIIICFSIKTL